MLAHSKASRLFRSGHCVSACLFAAVALGAVGPARSAGLPNAPAAATRKVEVRERDAILAAEQKLAATERRVGARHIETAEALLALGTAYRQNGRTPAAEKAWLRSLSILEALLPADHADVARCLYELGRLYEDTHLYHEARLFYERALPPAEKDGAALSTERQALKALVEPRLFDVKGMMGEYDGYIDYLARNFEPDQGEFIASRRWRFALNLLRRGRTEEAEAIITQGLADYKRDKGENSRAYASLILGLGNVYLQQARLADAEPLFETALRLFRAFDEQPAIMNTLESLAALRREQDRLDEAERLFESAREIARRTADPASDTTGLFGLSTVYLRQGRYADAEPLLRRALSTHRRTLSETSPILAFDLSAFSVVHAGKQDFGKALAAGREAVEIVVKRSAAASNDSSRRELKDFEWVFANHLQVLARVIANDPNGSAALIDEAFRTAQYAAHSVAGDSLSKTAARLAANDSALADLIRSLQDRQNRWQTTTLQLSKAVGENDAERVSTVRAELARIEAEIAALDQRLREQFPQYEELSRRAAVPVSAARNALRHDEALVFADVERDRAYLFVVKQAAVRLFVADIARNEIAALVRGLRDSLDPKGRSYFDLPAYDVAKAHRLYRTLLGPAEAMLRDAAHLVVVMSGPLQGLPPSVLVTAPAEPVDAPEGYRAVPWLIRRHAITVVPAVSSFVSFRRARSGPPARSPNTAFVGFGDPDFAGRRRDNSPTLATQFRGKQTSIDAIRKLPRLPETADELRAQAEALEAPADTIHLGPDATVTAVKTSDMSAVRVISFATHGLIAGELPSLGEPALVFTPPSEPTDADDGLLRASEVAGLRLNADFVVLSACNTAASDGVPGAEGLSGLAKAFFYAGARSLLVSHWPVNSRAAAQITTGVFKAFAAAPDIGRAEALRRSMLDLLDAPQPRSGEGAPARRTSPFDAHPSIWAPFVLVGESH
jgi:CHAT domain-containing protein/tetratricopeptide (TPR) repeat protein